MKMIPLCKPVFLSYKDFFFIKTQKTTILQQVTGGNTTNIILKRMLWYFSKLQHSRSTFKENARTFSNISTTQENIAISRKYIMLLFLKHKKHKKQKTTSWAHACCRNSKSSFKENARTFSKSSATQEIRTSKPKKSLWNLSKIEPKIKPMIENLRDELY